MASEFTIRRHVEFSDTDLAGIVHFSNFYKYMEQAEHAFFRSLGLDILNQQEDGSIISWPRVSAKCSFEAPAKYNNEIEIRMIVSRKGVKSLTFNFEFWHDGSRLARGSMKTVCCHFRHGEELKSIVIPDEYNDLIEEHPQA
jgi:YbgC/YbaW family acyl-CoA thioester hydrolase